jgi:hypothetical protein
MIWSGHRNQFTRDKVRKKYYVYALCQDEYSAPFYIGKGTELRCIKHHTTANKRKSPVSYKVVSLNNEYYVKILSESNNEDVVFQLERFYIKKFGRRLDGGTLLNITYGGKGTGFECLRDEEYANSRAENALKTSKRIFIEGFIFQGIRQASRVLGKARSHIKYLISNGRAFLVQENEDCYEKHQKYLDWLQDQNKAYISGVERSCKKVTTNRAVWIAGKVYSSAVEAAREVGVTPGAIQNRINRGNLKNTYYLDQLGEVFDGS